MMTLRRMFAKLTGSESKKVQLLAAAILGFIAFVGIGVGLSFVPPPAERIFVSHTGYTFRYPADWIVEAAGHDSTYESEVIREPRSRATISISSHNEPRLRELAGRAALIKEIELAFLDDERYKLDFLDWLSTDLDAKYNGYAASGSFENDGIFIFREIGIFDPSGEKLTFRSEVRSRSAKELVPIVDQVLLSARPGARKVAPDQRGTATPIDAEEAKARIEQLPYFAVFREAASERGEKFELEVEDGGTFWHVGLYGGSDGARFALERWRVDKQTGTISKVLP